jgi:hypothetical protein
MAPVTRSHTEADTAAEILVSMKDPPLPKWGTKGLRTPRDDPVKLLLHFSRCANDPDYEIMLECFPWLVE